MLIGNFKWIMSCQVLKVGNEYNIPKMVYHRLHKGEGRLIIDIKEYEERK